ncbi:MAG: XdhC family protein [Chloroflexi bacterium]|nr:XdhC family protein [Chloroflexota bacterium]
MSSDGFFARIAKLQEAGTPVAVATVVRASGSVPRREGARMLIYPDGRIEGTVGGGDLEGRVIQAALEALENGVPKSLHYEFRDIEQGDVGVCGGEVEVFVEAVRPISTVVVVGGGHVGASVAYLAHWLGFRVVVSDDRPEFATPEAVPGADEYIQAPLAELPDRINITSETYILLTTRGVPVDVDGLPGLLDSDAGYIGVIGSKRRWDTCAKLLAERGMPQEKIARVVSPMGLELNAETPEEIAVSMLAEIIMLRRGGSGEVMAHAPEIRKQA